MSKVASLFGGKKVERKKVADVVKGNREVFNLSENQGKSEGDLFDNLEKSRPNQKLEGRQNFILQAMDKAAERKIIQETLKEKRLERQLAEYEKENGGALRFDTLTDSVQGNLEEETATTENIENEEQKSETSIWPTDEEFEQMRLRYLQRLQTNDLLKFPSGKKAQTELLYYPEICGIPVL